MPTNETMNRIAHEMSTENFSDWDTEDAIYNGMKWLKNKIIK